MKNLTSFIENRSAEHLWGKTAQKAEILSVRSSHAENQKNQPILCVIDHEHISECSQNKPSHISECRHKPSHLLASNHLMRWFHFCTVCTMSNKNDNSLGVKMWTKRWLLISPPDCAHRKKHHQWDLAQCKVKWNNQTTCGKLFLPCGFKQTFWLKLCSVFVFEWDSFLRLIVASMHLLIFMKFVGLHCCWTKNRQSQECLDDQNKWIWQCFKLASTDLCGALLF